MTVRDGMAGLIRRLRQMTESGAADYSLAGETYWSDQHLQDVLDQHRVRYDGIPLALRPEMVAGASVYKRYEIPRQVGNFVEGVAGGAPVFRVFNSAGVNADTEDFSFNENDLSITFAEDQEGITYYWSGYGYDLQSAAREVWLMKAAHAYTAINFRADDHTFDREAIHQHCLGMARVFGYQQGARLGRLVRSDLAAAGGDGNKF